MVPQSHTRKQKDMAEHIEDTYRKRGVSPRRATAIAWKTVNKRTSGAHVRK